MKKRVVKLIVYMVIFLIFALGALIANNLLKRDNIFDRISYWPDVEVKTTVGETISTGGLTGQNPVLLIYFNTGCIFCRNMFEEILADGQLQQQAQLVFVSHEPRKTVAEYRKKTGLDQANEFIFLHDHKQKVKDFFGVRSVPATYLYTREGNLIRYYRGQVSVGEIIAELQMDH